MEKMMTTTNVNPNAITNANTYRVLLHDRIAYDNDDYYVFGAVLYDCEKKEIILETYGHGTDLNRNNLLELDEAVTNGIVKINEIKEYIIKYFNLSFSRINLINLACSFSPSNPMSIPVTIVGGRKGKGKKGSLIYGERKRNYYGIGQFREVYNEFAYVLLNDSNEIIKVNSFGYLQVDEEFINRYNRVTTNEILSQVELHKLSWLYAYVLSYSHSDTLRLQNYIETYSRLGESLFKSSEVINAISTYQAGR